MTQETLFDLPATSPADGVNDSQLVDEQWPEWMAPQPSACIPPALLAMQKMAHDLADLAAVTVLPKLGKPDRYLADRLDVVTNYIDRIIKPLECADER